MLKEEEQEAEVRVRILIYIYSIPPIAIIYMHFYFHLYYYMEVLRRRCRKVLAACTYSTCVLQEGAREREGGLNLIISCHRLLYFESFLNAEL